LIFHFFLNTGKEIGLEEHPGNDLFRVEWTLSITQSVNHMVTEESLTDRHEDNWGTVSEW